MLMSAEKIETSHGLTSQAYDPPFLLLSCFLSSANKLCLQENDQASPSVRLPRRPLPPHHTHQRINTITSVTQARASAPAPGPARHHPNPHPCPHNQNPPPRAQPPRKTHTKRDCSQRSLHPAHARHSPHSCTSSSSWCSWSLGGTSTGW